MIVVTENHLQNFNMIISMERTVVIIEDDRNIGNSLKDLIETPQINTILLSRVDYLLAASELLTIDLLVLDIFLPGMNGLEFLKQINERWPLIKFPVIVISAANKDFYKKKALDIGAIDFLQKPFDNEELLLKINSLLSMNMSTTNFVKCRGFRDDFVQLFIKTLLENMNDSNFKIKDYAKALNMSKRTLYRRIKNKTGKTPLELIKNIKLNFALSTKEQNDNMSNKQLANMIGYSNPSYLQQSLQEFKRHENEIK